MKKKKITFKQVYLIYVILLAIAAVAAVIYVRSLLHQYEQLLPEKQVEDAIQQLVEDAGTKDFFTKYSLMEMKAGRFEEQFDLSERYLSMYNREELTYTTKNTPHEEDELYYNIENNGVVLAEVKLKAISPVKTRLTVLSFREWRTEYIRPIVKAVDYTLTVPDDFSVTVNGIALTEKDRTESEGRKVTYSLNQLLLVPDIQIKDYEGNPVSSSIKDGKILAEFYDYTLTIPATLTVEVDGVVWEGEPVFDQRIKYDIRTLKKPVVRILDLYGNEYQYDGGNELPMTNRKVVADSRWSVTVNNTEIPDAAIHTTANPEYQLLTDYVEQLPQLKEYDIAVLKKDALIEVKDENGKAIPIDTTRQVVDATKCYNSLDAVPDEVSSKIDVLAMAQDWSLFMSKDKKFSEIAKYLIRDSYQYRVAVQYATGRDITFTSAHTLLNPAFTDSKVERFFWITEECFSVDISFVKHMRLRTEQLVDDYMNDRFYFVYYDDTDDGKDNPDWKIAGMKEIVSNENQ